MAFNAWGENDVHVSFQCSKKESNTQAIEVVLGGWSNTKSVIRLGTQGEEQARYMGPVLDPNHFRSYWV